jgi:hypothetical protein
VRLLAGVARIWLWVADGVRAGGRRDALEQALRRLPEDEAALRRSLALHRDLARLPPAPLDEILPAVVRISHAIARRLFPPGALEQPQLVELVGAGEPELALPARATDELRRLEGASPLVPLVDWRSVVVSPRPDEAVAHVPLEPERPETIAEALAASRGRDCYAALCGEGLLVLAAHGGGGPLRPLQCAATDPVTIALLAGEPLARFPALPGLSAADWARRAAAEHRAWLLEDPRSTALTLRALGRHLTAARAALFHESVAAGKPRLAVTVAAAAVELAARLPREGAAIEESAAAYRRCRLESSQPPQAPVLALRRAVLQLPIYAATAVPRTRAHVSS